MAISGEDVAENANESVTLKRAHKRTECLLNLQPQDKY